VTADAQSAENSRADSTAAAKIRLRAPKSVYNNILRGDGPAKAHLSAFRGILYNAPVAGAVYVQAGQL